MGLLKGLLFVSLLCLVTGDNGMIPGPNLSSSTASPTSSTTSTSKPTSPSTTTTTAKPTTTTTTKPTTTSTSKPTTTPTPKPTTTPTSKPTTTSTSTAKPTTSPTPKPTTSTTAQPTTTQKPTPIGHWVVNYTNTDRTCLLLEAQLDIDIHYKEGNATKNITVSVPSTATSKGLCDASIENVTLSFGDLNAVNFNFKMSNDNKTYDLDTIIVMLNVTVPGTNGSQLWVLGHNKTAFSTPVKNSYKCIRQESLDLVPTTKTKDYEGVLRVSHFQMQAFRNANNTKFDEALDCATSETPDAVPIAVGCALAALVIIVLVAYLIGRRRAQARGYLSM